MINFTIPSWTETVNSTSVQYANSSGTLIYNDTVSAVTEPYPRARVFQSPPLETQQIITIPIYCLVFLLSFVGNQLVIITLIQNKRMRTVTNVFLLNLSISDLLLAVFCMPFTIVPIMLKNFIFGPVICVMIRYLQAVSVSVSCFTLVAISLERYFAICRPLHSRKWQTLSHSYKTILVCWVLGFVVCIPIAVFTKYRKSPYGFAVCKELWDDHGGHKAYTIFLDVILLILPVIVMSISYGKISFTLWTGMRMEKQEMEAQNGHAHHKIEDSSRPVLSTVTDGFGRTIVPSDSDSGERVRKPSKLRFHDRGIRQTNSEKSRVAKKRVIKMLFAVVLEFFICWTPLFVLQTWMTIDYEDAKKHISQLLLSSVFLLSYVSSCCNPITYCFMNRNFRNGFLSVFRCRRHGSAVRRRNDIPSYCYHYSSARTGVSQFPDERHKDESDEV